MELTILLSKVFGIYMIIAGLVYMIRRKYFMSVLRSFVEQRMLRLILGMTEIIVGLFLVITHNIWDSLPASIVTLFGWLLLLEGVIYLLMPDGRLQKMIRVFNNKNWYIWGGVISIAAGAYLASFGFGLL